MGVKLTKSGMESAACSSSCHSSCASRDRMCSGADPPFEILVVMEISGHTSEDVVQWITHRITARKLDGGSELLSYIVQDKTRGVTIVFLGATDERYLRVAEYMKIKKPHKTGSLKPFRVEDIGSFIVEDTSKGLLACCEKQRIILHELESIHARTNESIKYHGIEFYRGEAVIARLQREGIIEKLFPLHKKKKLNELIPQWYRQKGAWLTKQPLDSIREYFGENIAMYFTFIGFYTVNLMLPAAVGFVCSFFKSSLLLPLFCLLNMVWTTVFLEAWKRRSADQAYRWGTFRLETFEEPRSTYYGPLVINPVTQRLEPRYSAVKHFLKITLVSCPVMILSLILSIAVMLGYFWMCDYVGLLVAESEGESITLVRLLINQSPNICYAVVIQILNDIYRRIAMALNDWENHRLQSSYENHLVTKLALFAFANSFSPLFYVAFYLKDMQLLRSHLVVLMATHMLVQQVFEAVVPYVTYRVRKGTVTRQRSVTSLTPVSTTLVSPVLDGHAPQATKSVPVVSKSGPVLNSVGPDLGSASTVLDGSVPMSNLNHGLVTEEMLRHADVEGTKAEYARTLDDYLELFIQFGYVYLFSAVFPLAALLALLNNIIEIRTDAFKLCRILRRPFAQPADGIGVWQVAFELLSAIAVITNCALVALSPSAQQYTKDLEPTQTFLIFVAIEHLILFIKASLSYLIPDEPESVRVALAIEEHRSKMSYKENGSVSKLEKTD